LDRKQDFLDFWKIFIYHRRVPYYFPTTVLILFDADNDQYFLNQSKLNRQYCSRNPYQMLYYSDRQAPIHHTCTAWVDNHCHYYICIYLVNMYPSNLLFTGFGSLILAPSDLEFKTMSTCYLCLESDSYFIPHNRKVNVWKILEYSGDKKGYNAYIGCYHFPIGINFQTLEDVSYFYSWSHNHGELKRSEDSMLYLLGAAAKHLNFTCINYNLVDLKRRSYCIRIFFRSTLNPTTLHEQLYVTKNNAHVLISTSINLVYCRTMDLKKKTNILSDLFSPFDRYVWSTLLLFLISLYFIPGFPFQNTIDLVWSIIGQPPQGKRTGFLMVSIAIVLTPMQSSYRDYFTTNAVIPYLEPYIDYNQELLDSGFRFLCGYHKLRPCLTSYFHEINASSTLKNLNWDWKNLEKYFFVNYSSSEIMEPIYVYISRGRDKVAYVARREHARREMIMAERVPDTQCHMLEESWEKTTHVLFYTGPLSNALFDTFNRLLQAGIMEFWEFAFKVVQNRRMNKLTLTNMDDTLETEIKSMNRSIESLFQIFLILNAVNIFCFIAEIVLVKLGALWNRWKTRRMNM